LARIKVRYFALLRELLGDTKEEEYEIMDGTTLLDLLLGEIGKRHPKSASQWKEHVFQTEEGEVALDRDGIPSLRGYYLILVNGKSYLSISEDGRQHGLGYKLRDGDEIAILPPVGGG
jgi:MoaD family protein